MRRPLTDMIPGMLVPADLPGLLDIPFTDEQLAAITAPLDPALIVAGAGSGKTSVMAARVVWLVATGQVAPDRVLGLTFTNKAAAELSGRVRTALRRAGLDAAGGADGEPTVSTYHAFAGRLVREHGLRIGVEPHARLLAEASRYQLAGRVLRRHAGALDDLTGHFDTVLGNLASLDSELSEHLVTPAQLVDAEEGRAKELTAVLAELDEQLCAGRKVKGHRDNLRQLLRIARSRIELAGLAAEYRAARHDLDTLDFGDQVAFAARLAAESPEVGVLERDRAEVVLLDEYQDTSVAQRIMLAGVFGGGHPVTAVGDPSQAIYGFRGASVSNLADFPEHFRRADGAEGARYELSVNQRSGGRLLSLANELAAAIRGRHPVLELHPRPGAGDAGRTVVALHDSWSDEVRWVASTLRRLIRDDGVPASGCAVLVRARTDIPDLYAGLLDAGLPVEVVGLGGLLTLPEVADVVATLRVVENPTDNPALLRLLTGPRFRLGARDLAALGAAAQQALRGFDLPVGTPTPAAGDPLSTAVVGSDPCDLPALADVLDRPGPRVGEQARARLARLGRELRTLRRHLGEPLLDLLHRIVETSGLDVELSASPEAVVARRRESLAAFLDVAADFQGLDGESSVSSFLGYLRAAEEYERGLDTATPSGADAVALMTVHKAKGLEWDVVAVPDLTHGVFPTAVVRDRWTTTVDALPGPLRGDAHDLPHCAGWAKKELEAFKKDSDEHLAKEEGRLGYVAMTRAKSVLIGSGHWWGPTQVRPRGPSPLLLTMRDHALAGNGEVAVWADQPADERNPSLGQVTEIAWPVAYEPAAYGRRRTAADLVLADLADLADLTGPADPAGRGGPADPAGRGGPADPAGRGGPADFAGPVDLAGSAEPGGPGDLAGPGGPDTGLTAADSALLAGLDRDAELLLAEMARDRDPVREVELPRSLTTSQVVRLRSDPGGLARDLARPLPRRPVPQARRGTRFHAWVETLWDQAPLLDPDDLPGAEDEGIGDDAELAGLQAAFRASEYARLRPVEIEVAFELALGGRSVRGRIDAVYEHATGAWEVVDWKTGTEPSDPVQLAVYRLAWARRVGVDVDAVTGSFFYVASGEVSRPPLLNEAGLIALLGS